MDWVKKRNIGELIVMFSGVLCFLSLGGTIPGLGGIDPLYYSKAFIMSFGFLGIGVVVCLIIRFFPKSREDRKGSRVSLDLGPNQSAFGDQITDWALFEHAAELPSAWDALSREQLLLKVKKHALNLLYFHGKQERKIENGRHYVRRKVEANMKGVVQ